MIWITGIEQLGGYRLLLTFNDGKRKQIDLEPHLVGEIFQPLRNPDYFRTVRLHPEFETIVWDNGADFAPEFLYEIGQAEERSGAGASAR